MTDDRALSSDEQGVAFPALDGRRSTSATAREVFADAARVADSDLAWAIEHERDWRKGYARHLRRLVEVEAQSTSSALGVADAGMESLHKRFVFERDGSTRSVLEALRDLAGQHFTTGVVEGKGDRVRELVVPYRGRALSGEALRRQLDEWVTRGIAEPSFAEAVALVMDNPDWLDVSGRTFVLFGAGAEMGPLRSLCAWGADVVAVDVPKSSVWERIIAAARAGSGRLHLPLRQPVASAVDDTRLAELAGADLLLETPEIGTWVDGFDGPFVLGNYAYADGAMFARLAMAVDALVVDLLGRHRDAAVAYLATPTDVFAVPAEAARMSCERFAGRGWESALQTPLRVATGSRVFAPNYPELLEDAEGGPVGITDCLVVQQGPNYALAKRLQRWRATLTHQAGVLTSAHVAPPTRTRSVVKNRILAAAYGGAPRFGVEVFEPETSNSLMAALLVHDLHNPPGELSHPHDLLRRAANPGGLWRQPFAPRTALPVAAVLGLVGLGKR